MSTDYDVTGWSRPQPALHARLDVLRLSAVLIRSPREGRPFFGEAFKSSFMNMLMRVQAGFEADGGGAAATG